MPRLLAEKVAVVTGGGRGLGRSHALALAAEGAAVLVNDLDREVADAVVDEIRSIGGRADSDGGDVSSLAGGAAVVSAALGNFGRVDVVVNNAGISRSVPIEDLDEEFLDALLGVHLKGVIGTTKAAFAAMETAGRGGRIVNTTSGEGLSPRHAGTTAYACAKAAVYAFTAVAAIEGSPHGITVNAISPLAATRMSAAFFEREPTGEASRRLDPAKVSVAVVYLASELSAGITGRVLRVEGDRISAPQMSFPTGIASADWTPQTIAARIDEILSS